MVYITLFFVSLISATLFPLGSEGLLIFNINEGYNLYALLIFATLGNVLGSIINYILGFKGEQFLQNKKILDENKIFKYKKFFEKYGFYSLFLSWAPIIGDPITLIAGVFKYSFKKFIFIVLISKFLRYLFLSFVTLYLI
ncbi:hypothetical protein CPU12_08005 [Malaciobacter molluscorum LMG 25693]|uniref:Membrane protein YqaA, SNARE-associated domain n=1 Tax=Malaciobacter molluscorum LMG 25693 TaxID=870501 RepID=A0A2G1DHG0_9BACT|nr:YqaA family protein [Malaciobacter molluscorum]AXX91055.1 membrane protein YqaA, SNARE-associated domain [Malaciobacter molluscorum LMG 25693]PHO17870.1 hypothetical protein CPU12_08005 [Malaciobacter molluscorum LMG 25693]